MTKPTGRPKGAPRKYESDEEKPITYSLRVPRALDGPLKQYAARHRQSMSELFLDGIRWRLTEGDPYGDGLMLPLDVPDAEKPYYENTDEGTMLVREVRELRTLLTEAVAAGALAAAPPQGRQRGRQDSITSEMLSASTDFVEANEINKLKTIFQLLGAVAVAPSEPPALAPVAAALPVAVEPSESVTPAPLTKAGYGALSAAVRAALAKQSQLLTCHALANVVGVEQKALHQVLTRLEKQGEVVKTGTQRTAVYALAPQV